MLYATQESVARERGDDDERSFDKRKAECDAEHEEWRARDIARPDSKRVKLAGSSHKWQHHTRCQACWQDADLINCGYCPVSMCVKCVGGDSGRDPWRCPHHACHGCGLMAHQAGGYLYRCAGCTKAFCEDCLPRKSRVINQSARFEALGFDCPKSAIYVLCTKRCAALARERA